MKRSVKLWQLMGFAVTSLGGTLLHFLYDWLDGAAWIAPFSGVNESTWEHMKLLFWPMLLFAAVESRFLRDRRDFWCVMLKEICLGLLLIPLLFYTYNGVIGKSPDYINIAIFFASAALAYSYGTKRLTEKEVGACHPRRAIFCLLFLGALFVAFTFRAPTLGIFRDPLTGGCGI